MAQKHVDCHVHLWHLGGELDYSWVNGSALERGFGLDDLRAEAGDLFPDQIVFVEAGCPPEQGVIEAQWVASIAEREPVIRGIVAAAPLERGAAARDHLERLASIPLVKGVRRLIQSEAAGFAVQPDFVRGVQLLAEYGFTFDICVKHHQLKETIELVRLCPDVRFILDHIGKPDIKAGLLDPWRDDIKGLAQLPNMFCKISGLVTEANYENWTQDDLKPYIDHVIESFGMNRVMFGGDWPVSTLATTYPRWVKTAQWSTRHLSESDHQRLFVENAAAFYRI